MALDLHAILDSVSVPVFALQRRANGRVEYVAFNKAACEALGRAESLIIGRTAQEVYQGRLGELLYERHQHAAAAMTVVTYQFDVPLRNGIRRILTTLRPCLSQAGKGHLFIGTSLDVSFEQGFKELRASSPMSHERDRLLGMAAHDLRSPVNKVRSLLEMLREEISDPSAECLEILDMLDTVLEGTKSLIGDVVSYAQTVDLEPEITEFRLEPLGREIIATLDPQHRHQIAIEDSRLIGEQVVVQIVLRNLLDNAIKHNAGRQVTMSIRAQPAEEGQFLVEVMDDGAGFSDQGRAVLDGGPIRAGSGYGLVGIKHLVTRRGGVFRADNRQGANGAVIQFTLPGSCLG